MQEYTNLTMFKNDYKKTENQPDMKLYASVKLENGEYKNIEVGAAWKKESNGKTFLSIKLADKPFTKEDGSVRPGFVLTEVGATQESVPVTFNDGSTLPKKSSLIDEDIF